jgi:hypothetical protein
MLTSHPSKGVASPTLLYDVLVIGLGALIGHDAGEARASRAPVDTRPTRIQAALSGRLQRDEKKEKSLHSPHIPVNNGMPPARIEPAHAV